MSAACPHNWAELPDFTPREFPDSRELAALHPSVLTGLQATRTALGAPIYPSQADGAMARWGFASMKSQHYAQGRKSTAIDWFTDADPLHTWYTLVADSAWAGVGIYFDTRDNNGDPAIMFHTDFGRMRSLMWLRAEGRYHYPGDGARFWLRLRAGLGLL